METRPLNQETDLTNGLTDDEFKPGLVTNLSWNK